MSAALLCFGLVAKRMGPKEQEREENGERGRGNRKEQREEGGGLNLDRHEPACGSAPWGVGGAPLGCARRLGVPSGSRRDGVAAGVSCCSCALRRDGVASGSPPITAAAADGS